MRYSTLSCTAAIVASAAFAAKLQRRIDIFGDGPTDLANCPDKGQANTCRYEAISQGDDARIGHIVGDPVGNCQGGSTDITLTVGGDSIVDQTWKLGVEQNYNTNSSIKLPGAKVTNSTTWTSTDSITFRQNIDITVSPGQKAALVAKVLHHTYFGRMVINYESPVGEEGDQHYEWYSNNLGSIQPTEDVIYDQRIVTCAEDI